MGAHARCSVTWAAVNRPPNLQLNKGGAPERPTALLGVSVSLELLPGHRENSLKVSG